jgi:hypothetical protein
MKDLGYAYLHCDLLDKVVLTRIAFRVKSLHIDMHEQYLQKACLWNFNIESKSKKGFEKGDMHVVITLELTMIVSLIITFELKLVPMFFHMNFIHYTET